MTRTLPLLRGSIVSKEAFEDIGAERFATNPIGSGLYMFEEWQPGERIILTRNEDYYSDLPDFERVEIYPIVEGGQGYQTLRQIDRPGMHVASYTLNPDPGYWTEWYTNNQIGSWNYMHWENDVFQEIHDRANLESDRDQRAELYVEM